MSKFKLWVTVNGTPSGRSSDWEVTFNGASRDKRLRIGWQKKRFNLGGKDDT